MSTTTLAQPVTKGRRVQRPTLADIPAHNAEVLKRAEAILGARVFTEDPFIENPDLGPWIDEAWIDARAASHGITGEHATKGPDPESRRRVWRGIPIILLNRAYC